ncbi:MAG TPA: 4Fe-4S binding protein, partial [Chitinophagaceae bacterium]
MLKKTRVAVSLLFFSVLTLYFLDFAELLPRSLHWLTRVQLVPALLALNGVVLCGLALITLLLGRVYCSSLCPMGVFQDVVDWIA